MGMVIGIVGWPCAGKDEASEYLQETHGAIRLGHSDRIRELASRQGIWNPKTSDLSALFEAEADHSGYGWIASRISELVLERWCQWDFTPVVITGVRNMEEVEVYSDLDGFQLVRIEANRRVRFERWCRRARAGDGPFTWEQFLAIEALPGNTNLPALMTVPAHVIVNNGSLAGLYTALDELFDEQH